MNREKIFRYVGGGVALFGLAFTAAFIGRRTASPVLSMFIEVNLITQIAGIIGGLVLIGLGLGIIGHLGAPKGE